MKCRFCATRLDDPALDNVFLDLGSAPPSNAFLSAEHLAAPERWFPLKLHTCPQCLLVQVDEVQSHAELFAPDYVYFSSYSSSWLVHARSFVEQATRELQLGSESLVVEIASNDGYLLQYVADGGIPCVGIEPTAGTAEVARAKGIETLVDFFGAGFARNFVSRRRQADLVVANNVLAHVPDLNDFVAGLGLLLAPNGVAAWNSRTCSNSCGTASSIPSTMSTFPTSRCIRCVRCSPRMVCASTMWKPCRHMAVRCGYGPAMRMAQGRNRRQWVRSLESNATPACSIPPGTAASSARRMR